MFLGIHNVSMNNGENIMSTSTVCAWEVNINGKISVHISVALAVNHMRMYGTGTMRAVWC